MLPHEAIEQIKKGVKGKTWFGEEMKNHTSLRIGGKADALIMPEDVGDLSNIFSIVEENRLPVTVVGNGTKLLVCDDGIEGVVIKLSKCFEKLTINNTRIQVEAGYPLAKLSKLVADRGLSGMEFAVDIPGTVGGAITMNAGAFGSTISDVTVSVTSMNYEGHVRDIEKEKLAFGPRKSMFQDNSEIVLTAQLELLKGEKESIQEKMSANTQKRLMSQPYDYPSAGSIFKNPPNDSAGRLIDSLGLKGRTIGGAMVSNKHANFIVNTGGAKAEDVYQLIKLIQEMVRSENGITLEPEIRLIGKFN